MVVQKEKTTINLPLDLKRKIQKWKEELGKTQSEIIDEALREYFEKKEKEKWQKGVELAMKDQEYMQFCQELGNDDGGIV